MPITRSVWVDDDGTGTTGTPINNAELQKIYTNIDAFGNGVPQVLGNTETGTLNDWAPAGLGQVQNSYIHWTGTADATITGIRAGTNGQILTIRNRTPNGLSTLAFAYYSPLSASENRLVTPVSSGAMMVAYDGFIQFVYVTVWASWFMLGHEQGAWVLTPFNASDYAGGITVTAGQVESRYRLSGRTLQWGLNITGGTLSGSITQFYIHLPQRFRLASVVNNSILLGPGGAWGVGRMGGGPGIDNLNVTKLDYSAMAAGPIYLQATIIQELT